MDTSLCLYKGKLKEALTLVPTMSPEKKVEAVAYWNDLAEQLQEIVHDNNPDYEQVLISSSLETRDGEAPESNFACATVDAIVDHSNMISGLLPCSSDTLVPSDIKPSSVGQFHQENMMDEVFESSYMGQSPTDVIKEVKSHSSSMIENKINQSPMNGASSVISPDFGVATQSNITCSSNGILGSVTCTTNQISSAIQTNNPYDVLKHPSMLTQVPNHHLGGDIFCSDIERAQTSDGAQVLNYMSNNNATFTSVSNVSKITEQANVVDSNTEFDNILIGNSLGCAKTTSAMADDIGNGQFDRGPKSFNNADDLNQFMVDAQAITLDQTAGQNILARNEMFTQGARPLQQIQLFNPGASGFMNSTILPANIRARLIHCDACQGQFNTSEELSLHQQQVHSYCKDSLQSPNLQETRETSMNSMEVKKETFSSSEKDKLVPNNNQHACEVCGKSGFSTKGNLKRHLRAHSGEKPFKCEYCESCFTEKKSLKIHVRRHTGEKPYKCEICEKFFSQTGVLQSHMALHLNERKFECQKCGKAFRQRSQLKLHLMRHDGVKRQTCQTCMAKFLTKGDLERHRRIHTGERPYACKICSKTFTRQQSLNEHMNRHTGRKPYDCKVCQKTFSEMSACYKHAKTHKKQDLQQQSLNS